MAGILMSDLDLARPQNLAASPKDFIENICEAEARLARLLKKKSC